MSCDAEQLRVYVLAYGKGLVAFRDHQSTGELSIRPVLEQLRVAERDLQRVAKEMADEEKAGEPTKE